MLRPEILEIVQELAEDDNLPLSRTCGILIEQALVSRALWDNKTRKRIPKEATEDPHYKSVTKNDIIDSLPDGVETELVTKKAEPLENDIDLDPELLALAKKLKALKQLDLL